MKDLIAMWRYPRMIMYVAVTAATYAVLLVPFKGPIIPIGGWYIELRVATVVPIVFSFLFGPAAAWGSAIGDCVGAIFGTPDIGLIFGFIGNLMLGYVPYKAWNAVTRDEPGVKNARKLALFLFGSFLACATVGVIGVIIPRGLDLLGWLPFGIISIIVTLDDFIFAAILGPPVLSFAYDWVKSQGALYSQIMGDLPKNRMRRIGLLLLTLSTLGGLTLGNAYGLTSIELAPFLLVMFVSAAFM